MSVKIAVGENMSLSTQTEVRISSETVVSSQIFNVISEYENDSFKISLLENAS